MEGGRAAKFVGYVNSIEKHGVKMRIAPQVARSALNHSEATAVAVGGAAREGGRACDTRRQLWCLPHLQTEAPGQSIRGFFNIGQHRLS